MDHKDIVVICCLLLLGTLTFLERGKEIVSWKVYIGCTKGSNADAKREKKIPKRRVHSAVQQTIFCCCIRVTVCCMRLTF